MNAYECCIARDRRSLGSSPKPSGVLIGHTEGITYVSAKGDGRYVISNGKDQVCRLWDLRKMRSNLEFEQVEHKHYGIPHFDYRWVLVRDGVNRLLTEPIQTRSLSETEKQVTSIGLQRHAVYRT